MMELRRMGIGELKRAPYNPRVPLVPGSRGFERLRRSLAEFDLVQPIVWNERTGHVVGGHQRLEVLKYEGVTEVDVVVVSLPLEREKALNVALNNSQLGSDWDIDKLTDLLSELVALPDFDATLTGFDEKDLQDLLLAPADLPAEEPESPEETLVRVTLEVQPDQWPAVRGKLDELLREFSGVAVHVRGTGE